MSTQPINDACSTIAIIEDDEAIRESVQDILELEGYHVMAFANGKEAIEGLASHENPCLILLDLMMPVMDGWQFLQARKLIRDTITSIPVVIVSAWADQVKRQNISEVSGYIKKPVDIDILLNIVNRYCSRQAQAA